MAVKKSNSELRALVKQTRKLAGLTQAELAELAGVGKTLVFNLENGHEKIALDNLKKILSVLNIQIQFKSPAQLLTANSAPTKEAKK
jgi:y4mF family transcriptional regulator